MKRVQNVNKIIAYCEIEYEEMENQTNKVIMLQANEFESTLRVN